VINAEGGDIIFGDCNIIEEYVNIVNYARKDASGNIMRKTMKIGNYNLFEVGAVIESTDIGDLNEFGVKSVVAAGSLVGNSCQINAMVQVPQRTKVPSNSVYYEPGNVRVDLQPRDAARKL
jgi:dynactin-6